MNAQPGGRRPDRPRSTASRAALLNAAGALFGEYGYEGATVREIAERAGVDQALIVRYFGCKAELYHAAVKAGFNLDESPTGTPTVENVAHTFISGIDEEGIPAALWALLQLPIYDEAQATASEKFERLAMSPLEEALRDRGYADPRTMAEVVVASLIGVVLMRRSATFAHLAAAEPRWIAQLIDCMIDPAREHVDGKERRRAQVKTTRRAPRPKPPARVVIDTAVIS